MNLETALQKAKQDWMGKPGVTAVYVGLKRVGGVTTDQKCIVVAVEQKKPLAQLKKGEVVPRRIAGEPTDIVQTGTIKALELTERIRPAPGGYSCGHFKITAGTLGAWVQNNQSQWLILSNNHVLADSNGAAPADEILQPGPYDGGKQFADRIARLTEFVKINFAGVQPPPKKRTAIRAWALWLGAANAVAKLVKCPYRAQVVNPRAVEQPNPNLVDAAVAATADPTYVQPNIALVGPVKGIRDAQLGEKVLKAGRTTGLTRGIVEGVNGSSQVSYGEKGTAKFDDQLIIRAQSGEFSAGGDSGSVILSEDGYIVGLLFAGGEGITIANRISNVVSLLGIRVPATLT